ncbi:MAG TPA: hypothetical protein VFH58_07360 [Acidimicrobiales bacterium]|nr:hypothetical protein [Acidimicrobiales bacterium]
MCPLIFQYRSEVEWHLREEHRSRADEAAELRSQLAAARRPLDWDYLQELRSSEANPSVTLLLATAPAATMNVLDTARLRQLAEGARRRLSAEPDRETAVSVVEDRLARAVSAAESQATDRGIAVLVNRDHLAVIPLPFAPRDRHVVDRTFATRDLEYTLRRFPRYRVLVLGRHPRVLEGYAHQLAEAPAASPDPDPDSLLGERIEAAGRLPLVVIGDHRHLDLFDRDSAFAGEVVAQVPRPRLHKGNVLGFISDALGRIHQQRQARSVAELLHADLQSRVEWGLGAAWRALHSHSADRLWVEHDYAVPGHVAAGDHAVEPTTDPTEPGAVDDLVDALLARAAQLGVETHIVERQSLRRPEPVAVRVRFPTIRPAGHRRMLATA